MDGQNWEHLFKGLIGELKDWAEAIISTNRNFLLDLQKELKIVPEKYKPNDDEALLQHVLNLCERWKVSGPAKESEALENLYIALYTLYLFNNSNLKNSLKLRSFDYESLYTMYLLGCSQGAREGVDLELLSRKPLEGYFHKKRSRELVNQGRWEPFKKERKKLLDEIRVEAEKRYSDGYDRWHHDLASQIKKKPKYSEVPINDIRKAIGPVAEKFGKKFGIKKEQK